MPPLAAALGVGHEDPFRVVARAGVEEEEVGGVLAEVVEAHLVGLGWGCLVLGLLVGSYGWWMCVYTCALEDVDEHVGTRTMWRAASLNLWKSIR